jgi:hypothetical protein
MKILKYTVFKPSDEDKDEFIERISNNLDMFVHNMTNDLSVTVTYDEEREVLNIKTLKLNEYAN